MSRYDSQAVVVDDATRKGQRKQHETHRCSCGHYASIHIREPAAPPHGHFCGSCAPGASARRLTRMEAARRQQNGPAWAQRHLSKGSKIAELEGGQKACNAAIKQTCEAFFETEEWKAAVLKWQADPRKR